MESHDHSYVNPNNVTLEWECFVVSKSDMLLDGVPNELINTWLDKDIIKPFCVKNNDINFRTKDVWYALNQQNWY